MAIILSTGWYIVAACLISAGITWALVHGLERTNPQKPMPYGGVAVFTGFWVSFFLMFPTLAGNTAQGRIFLASAIVLITGMLDDHYELNPWQKSIGILLAAHIIYFMTDIQFSSILIQSIPDNLFALLSYVLTILWIYLITNAVNLLDGLDGLVSSVSINILLTLIILTLMSTLSIRLTFIMMLILLAAAILGFLPFNWVPAKLYLGDTGALFIGFMFATLTVYNLRNVSFFTLVIPILFYALPLFETGYTVIRRLMNGQSIVARDENHLHHRLLRRGLSVAQVVLIMNGLTTLFALLAIVTQLFRPSRMWLLGGAILILVTLLFNIRRMDS